jgi:hypothetical protein
MNDSLLQDKLMTEDVVLLLKTDDLDPISSPYLKSGLQFDTWRIVEAAVCGMSMQSIVSMDHLYAPSVGHAEFHLSYLKALEFVSQLQIVHMHVLAGLRVKTMEVWMVEMHLKSSHPIRDSRSINVASSVLKFRKSSQRYYCTASHRVSDRQGGHFEIWIKSLMA